MDADIKMQVGDPQQYKLITMGAAVCVAVTQLHAACVHARHSPAAAAAKGT